MKLSFSTLLLTSLGITFIATVHSSAPISPVDDLQTENQEGDLTAKLNQFTCLPPSCVSSGCCSGNCGYWCRVCGVSYAC